MRNDLARRVVKLEGATGPEKLGPAILLEQGETQADALARWEAEHGKRAGEPVFIRLVGVEPASPATW